MNLGDKSQNYDHAKRKIDCETCNFTKVKNSALKQKDYASLE